MAEETRFVCDTDGKIIDILHTSKGSYLQPNGFRTDVLQDKPHFNKRLQEDHGTSHTHETYTQTNPVTDEIFTGVDRNNTHVPTFEEILNITEEIADKIL